MNNLSRIQLVADKLAPEKGLTEVLHIPSEARDFVSHPAWKQMCEKFVKVRWEKLLDALNAHDFPEKEYNRGFVECLQFVMELPAELFKQEDSKNA